MQSNCTWTRTRLSLHAYEANRLKIALMIEGKSFSHIIHAGAASSTTVSIVLRCFHWNYQSDADSIGPC